MQVRVLGQVEAVDGESAVIALGGPTPRRVLAALAMRRNEVVSVPYLVDVLWPDRDTPHRAGHNVRTYVHRLRAALGENGGRLETVGAGYRLRLADDDLDAARFERLAGTAARLADTGDLVAALDAMGEAERMWHGAPFEEFAHEDWALAEATRLEALRASMRTLHAETLLAAGRVNDALVALERLVGDEPLRERPRALHMRALYESGRQAEALRAFQEFRRALVEEIGVEPSSELVALDRAIATRALPASETATRSVGGYELHERIGEGAFAIVHRATQRSLDREVAIKIIRAELANRPEFIRRFEAEARMVARIEHQHVVPLYDYWREPDRAFLVMRWMTGGSLQARLDDGPWTIEATVVVVEQIAAALDAAHRQGVVHRDVKPENILFDDSGHAFLGDFGIALDAATRSQPEAALSEGSPVFAAPEQLRREPVGPEADVHALAIVAYTMLVGRTPFADAPDAPTLLQRQLHEPIPPARSQRPELPQAVETVLAIATAKDPSDRYPTATGFAAEFRRVAVGNDVRVDRALVTRPRTNPYKGLRPFDETDAADFFGRERLVDELVGHLATPDARMVAVVGPSGSGKSSVVRAGLVAALRHGAVPGSIDWYITTLLPGSRPFEALETALLRIAVNPPAALLDQLRDGDRGILRAVKRIVPNDGGVVAIVIDQFEELFTRGVADDERDRFLRGLATAVNEPASPVRLLLTIRADFYDRPLRHPEFARLLKAHAVVVTPLAPDELEHAIVTPAASVGVTFEPGLVAEIIADVRQEPGALPLLQYALTQSFEETAGTTISLAAYHSVGGLVGALARRADEIVSGADVAGRIAARQAFGRLITLGEGTEDTRRRVRLTELNDDSATRDMLHRFGEARLLTFDRDPTSRAPTVEIAHEALIREWPRLRSWLDDDREVLRVHRHLTRAATSWDDRDREPSELYRGARLVGAEPLLTSDAVSLSTTEAEFLTASLERRDADAETEQRRVRRLRRLVTATAAVAAIALIAGVAALWQWQRADDQAVRAEASAREASDNADAADRNAREAEANAAIADENAERADANAADAEASAVLAEQRAIEAEAAERRADIERMRAVALASAAADPSVASLLAVEAHRLDPSAESLDALQRVLTEIPGYHGSIAAGPYVDGKLLGDDTFVAVSTSAIDVWDLVQHRLVRSIVHDSPNGATIMDVVGSDHVAVLDTGRRSTSVFRLSTGANVASIAHDAVVNDLAGAPDGGSISAALDDGALEIWSIGDGVARTARLDTGAGGALFVRWHPAGDRLAVVTLAAEAQLWDVATERRLWATEAPPAGITNQRTPFAAAFSPAGDLFAFAAGSLAGTLRTLATDDGSDAFAASDLSMLTGFVLDDLTWVDDHTLRVATRRNIVEFDLRTGTGTTLVEQYVLAARAVAHSPAIERYVIAGLSGLEFWTPDAAGPLARVVPLSPEQLTALRAGAGPQLVSLSADGSRLLISLFSLGAQVPTTSVDLTASPISTTLEDRFNVTIGYGEFTAATIGFAVVVLDAELEPLGPPIPLPFDYSELGVSEDGRFVAFGRLGGMADVYRTDGEFLGTVALGDDSTFAAVQVAPWFTSDGEFMTLTTTDGRAGLWKTEGLDRVELGEYADVPTAAFGPWLFTRTTGGAMQRLDPTSLEPVGEAIPLNGLGWLGYAKFDSANDRLVATGSEVAKVFDIGSGRQLGRDLPYAGGSTRVEFTADGAMLSVPQPGFVVLWNFDTDSWDDIACVYAGRNLTAEEWDQLGPRTIDHRPTCDRYAVE